MVWAGTCSEQWTRILLTALWKQRDGPSLCHSSMTITSWRNTMTHSPVLQASVNNSQHTPWTWHPLSVFGILWTGGHNSVFLFLQYPAMLRSHWREMAQHSTADHLFVKEMRCTSSEPNKQQVLAYNVSEGWGHTNDAAPEACWQVCCAGAGPDLQGCGCLPLTDIDFLRGRALAWCRGDYHVLPPDMCCVWGGIFRCLKAWPWCTFTDLKVTKIWSLIHLI